MMANDPNPFESEVLLYTTPGGGVRVEVFYQTETFWLSQRRMAELFGVEVNTINYHCKEIFASKELAEEGTIRKIRIVQKEGERDVAREVDFYSLDMVIAVGYRVNSFRATQFRIWATKTLREFIVKGFVLDDERLKQGKQFGASGASTSRSPTSTSSAARTTTQTLKSRRRFSKPFRTNCIGPSPEGPPPRLLPNAPTRHSRTWG